MIGRTEACEKQRVVLPQCRFGWCVRLCVCPANEHAESEFVVNFAMLWPYVEVGHKVLAQARTSARTSGGDGAGTAGNHGDIGRKQHEVLHEHVDCDLGRLDRLQLATVCDLRHKFKIMSVFSC